MPASSKTSKPWDEITEEAVTKLLSGFVKTARAEGQLESWIERKFNRDEAKGSYFVGQFDNDFPIFRTAVREFIKHPHSVFLQFRGGGEGICMWRWDSAPLLPESSAEEKYLAYKNGHLVECDGASRDAALEKVKEKATLIVVAHGPAFTKINKENKLPEETAAGLTGEQFAENIEPFLQNLAMNGVNNFYTRFIVCNIVMPQERGADENGFIGSYVSVVSQTHFRFDRVEASGAPFIMEGSSEYTGVRRLLLEQPRAAASSNTLVTHGWGQKFRVSMEGGQLEDTGFQVTLTAFEHTLACLSSQARCDLFTVMDHAQSLLSTPATSTAVERNTHPDHWQPLKLVILAIPPSLALGKKLWADAELIAITGAPQDAVEITQTDGSVVRIQYLRRDLSFFKEKMAHFPQVEDAKVTDQTIATNKNFVQAQFRYLNAIERNFSPHAWQRPDGGAFSCLVQIGDYRNDEMKVHLSLFAHDADFNQIARSEIYAQTDAVPGTRIVWRAIRAKGEEGHPPDRAVARALTTMSDDDLAASVVFDITLVTPESGAVEKKSLSFTKETTKALVACTDKWVNAENPVFAKKILTMNAWHRRGLVHAVRNTQTPVAGYQDDVTLVRPANAAAIAAEVPLV